MTDLKRYIAALKLSDETIFFKHYLPMAFFPSTATSSSGTAYHTTIQPSKPYPI